MTTTNINSRSQPEANRPLILASSSPYRRLLLERLGLPFSALAPAFDESPLAGETPGQLVSRLALGKASSLQGSHAQALIIGSDQVAVIGSRVLAKPGTMARAREQLRQMSGQRVRFLTGLCLLNASTGRIQQDIITVEARMRTLSAPLIEHCLALDQPLDCAGAFKSEAAGITLVEALTGDDPTALIGLPLIRLTDFLIAEKQWPWASLQATATR